MACSWLWFAGGLAVLNGASQAPDNVRKQRAVGATTRNGIFVAQWSCGSFVVFWGTESDTNFTNLTRILFMPDMRRRRYHEHRKNRSGCFPSDWIGPSGHCRLVAAFMAIV
jgi:hypothetical protein